MNEPTQAPSAGEPERYDAVLATDVCGNKDVVMRERVDGIFMRYDDHASALRQRDERITELEHEMAMKIAAAKEYHEKLERQIETLSAPVTDAEMDKFAIHHIQVVQPHRTLPVLTHDSADRLIAARKEQP